MIHSVEIENFRGIRRGALKDLGALTILTGPNGCGKSTIIDALLISASPEPGEAIGQAVKRHRATHDGARWLVRRGENKARIVLRGEPSSTCDLSWRRSNSSEGFTGPPPYSRVLADFGVGFAEDGRQIDEQAFVRFSGDGSFIAGQDLGITHPTKPIRLVDSSAPVFLVQAYSETYQEGRKEEVLEFLKALVPKLGGVEIAVEADGTPMVYVEDGDTRIPASHSGDGINAFLHLALELAASPGGLVLVEEPEFFQHLRTMRQSGKALLATMRRDVQVILTTHSLEMIDAIVHEAAEEDLNRIVLFNLLLSNGELKYSRLPGPDVAFARESMEKDLR